MVVGVLALDSLASLPSRCMLSRERLAWHQQLLKSKFIASAFVRNGGRDSRSTWALEAALRRRRETLHLLIMQHVARISYVGGGGYSHYDAVFLDA